MEKKVSGGGEAEAAEWQQMFPKEGINMESEQSDFPLAL